jgi:hypothetical protein
MLEKHQKNPNFYFLKDKKLWGGQGTLLLTVVKIFPETQW